jgi:hypothetical protein
MLADAELAIKRLNFGKAKLDKVLSFGRPPHNKVIFSYDGSNKTTITHRNLTVEEVQTKA